MSLLPVQLAHQIASCPEQQRWLIEGLWADQAVGVVGGEPKCGKSFMVLDMAVAVASGMPCLRRFSVNRRGRVLLFAAEDALHVVRQRLDGICHCAGLDLRTLDIHVITAPIVRLDLDADRHRLSETIGHIKPRLLVLDPFVRLHCRNENASQDVAPLLAFLRELQRKYHLAVVVVHHSKKGAANTRAGQALRGSSEFHAWGDSNLYLRRRGEILSLSIEHRAAPSCSGIPLRLNADGDTLCLEIVDQPTFSSPQDPPFQSVKDRVEHAFAQADGPLSFKALRNACHVRTSSLCGILGDLSRQGKVRKTSGGYEWPA